jgi:hypothetical protein
MLGTGQSAKTASSEDFEILHLSQMHLCVQAGAVALVAGLSGDNYLPRHFGQYIHFRGCVCLFRSACNSLYCIARLACHALEKGKRVGLSSGLQADIVAACAVAFAGEFAGDQFVARGLTNFVFLVV